MAKKLVKRSNKAKKLIKRAHAHQHHEKAKRDGNSISIGKPSDETCDYIFDKFEISWTDSYDGKKNKPCCRIKSSSNTHPSPLTAHFFKSTHSSA